MTKIIENFKELRKKYDELDIETIATLKYGLFFLIIGDLFGLWWYFEMKKLAMAFLIVFVAFLALILLAERRYYSKMEDEYDEEEDEDEDEDEDEEDNDDDDEEEKTKKHKKKKLKKKKRESDNSGQWNFGIPDAEEYNKRLREAIGFGSSFS